jgi:hypothetical protein
MRKLLLILILIIAGCPTFSQNPDTLTPEKKARWKIRKMAEKRTAPSNASDLGNTLTTIADMTARRIPFMSQADLRNGQADTARVVYINEGLRSGTFRYDPTNTKAPDDSSMVIVSGNRRYIREDLGYVRPEWFGANPNDKLDDAPAIQKMLNTANSDGLMVEFDKGRYFIGSTVTFKNVSQAPEFNNKLMLNGKGAARTNIAGLPGFKGDMFFINTGANGGGKSSFVTIQNIEFAANQSARILYGTHVVALKIYDCIFGGGEDCGIQIGTQGGSESYSVYMKNNYHNGQAYGSGQIPALLRLYSARMFVIDGMESDGGRYAIEMTGNSDKNIIVNCKLEGAKRAGIYMNNTGGGGGENQILNNTINPYVGIESKALFDGESNCIELNSMGGANAFNTIRGNLLLCSSLEVLPFTATVKNYKGKFLPASSPEQYGIVGQSSGAVGFLAGFDEASKRLIIQVISGTFKVGEIVKQRTTNASALIGSLVTKHSHAIKLTGGGGTNIIAENRIRGLPEYGIYNESNDNIIIGNAIEALNGIYSISNSGALIADNSIFSPGGTAVNRVKGILSYSNNRILGGKIVGVSDIYLPSAGGIVGGNLSVTGTTTLGGTVTAAALPIYANNEAAKAAGLINGALYRTPTGEVRVKY